MTNEQEQYTTRSAMRHTAPGRIIVDDWDIAGHSPVMVGMGALGGVPRSIIHGPHEVFELIHEQTYLPQDKADLNELKRQIASLERAISTCLDLLGSLSDHAEAAAAHRPAAINSITIEDDDVILARPLFFLIEEYEDDNEVVARIPELQADGFGQTELHAINELKVMLGELYQDLIDTPDEDLGRLPLQWKHILKEVVGTNATKKL